MFSCAPIVERTRSDSMINIDKCGDTKIVTSPRRLTATEIEELKDENGRWSLVAVVNVSAGYAYHFQKV